MLEATSGKSKSEFLSANAARIDDLWVMVHLPKTAGTTVASQLLEMRQPSLNLYIDGKADNLTEEERWQGAIDEFLKRQDTSKIRFLTGHFPVYVLDRILVLGRTVRFFTFMRDPVSRFISDYRYCLTPRHPHYKEFRITYPKIEDYLKEAYAHDRMFKQFAPAQDASVSDVIASVRKKFTFLGFTEKFDQSVDWLGKLLCVSLNAHQRLNETATLECNSVQITEQLRERIAEANKRDIEIYSTFYRKFSAFVN